MKKFIRDLIKAIALPFRLYFGHEKLIYSKNYKPGKYQFSYKFKGQRLVRIAFTDQVKFIGTVPMTDLFFDDITAVKKLPSKFQKDMAKLFGYKAKSIITHFTKPAETNGK